MSAPNSPSPSDFDDRFDGGGMHVEPLSLYAAGLIDPTQHHHSDAGSGNGALLSGVAGSGNAHHHHHHLHASGVTPQRHGLPSYATDLDGAATPHTATPQNGLVSPAVGPAMVGIGEDDDLHHHGLGSASAQNQRIQDDIYAMLTGKASALAEPTTIQNDRTRRQNNNNQDDAADNNNEDADGDDSDDHHRGGGVSPLIPTPSAQVAAFRTTFASSNATFSRTLSPPHGGYHSHTNNLNNNTNQNGIQNPNGGNNNNAGTAADANLLMEGAALHTPAVRPAAPNPMLMSPPPLFGDDSSTSDNNADLASDALTQESPAAPFTAAPALGGAAPAALLPPPAARRQPSNTAAHASSQDTLIAYANTQLMMHMGAVRHQRQSADNILTTATGSATPTPQNGLLLQQSSGNASADPILVETRSLLSAPRSLNGTLPSSLPHLMPSSIPNANGSGTGGLVPSTTAARLLLNTTNASASAAAAATRGSSAAATGRAHQLQQQLRSSTDNMAILADTVGPDANPNPISAISSTGANTNANPFIGIADNAEEATTTPNNAIASSSSAAAASAMLNLISSSSIDCAPMMAPSTAPQSFVTPMPNSSAGRNGGGPLLLSATTASSAAAAAGNTTTNQQQHSNKPTSSSTNSGNPKGTSTEPTTTTTTAAASSPAPPVTETEAERAARRLRDRALMMGAGRDAGDLIRERFDAGASSSSSSHPQQQQQHGGTAADADDGGGMGAQSLSLASSVDPNTTSPKTTGIPLYAGASRSPNNGKGNRSNSNPLYSNNASFVSSVSMPSKAALPPPPSSPMSYASLTLSRNNAAPRTPTLGALMPDEYVPLGVMADLMAAGAGTSTGGGDATATLPLSSSQQQQNSSAASSARSSPEMGIVEINGRKVHVVYAPPSLHLPSPAQKPTPTIIVPRAGATTAAVAATSVAEAPRDLSVIVKGTTTVVTSEANNADEDPSSPNCLVVKTGGGGGGGGSPLSPTDGKKDSSSDDEDDEAFKIPTWMFYLACGVLMTDAVGTSMLYSYVGLLVAHVEPSLTASSSGYVAGVLVGAFQAAQVVTMPLWGRVSDIVGRKSVMLTALVLSVSASLMFGFASSFWQLLLIRVLHGTVCAGISVGKTYIFEVTTPKSQAKGFGYMNLSWSLGSFIGPSIGGFLYDINTSPIFSKFLPHMALFDTFPALGPALALSTYGIIIALLSRWYLPESRPDCVPVGVAAGWFVDYIKGKFCCAAPPKAYVDAGTSPMASASDDDVASSAAVANKSPAALRALGLPPTASPNINPTVIYSMKKGAEHAPSSSPPLRPAGAGAGTAVVAISDNGNATKQKAKGRNSRRQSPALSPTILYVESPRTGHFLDEVPIAIFTPQHVPMQIMYKNDEEVAEEQRKIDEAEEDAAAEQQQQKSPAVSRRGSPALSAVATTTAIFVAGEKKSATAEEGTTAAIEIEMKEEGAAAEEEKEDPYAGKRHAALHRSVDEANEFLNEVPLITTRQILTHPLLRYTIPMGMLIACVNVTYNEIWPLYAIADRDKGGMGMTSTHIGIAGMMNAVIALMVNGVFDKLCKRFKHMTLWSVGNLGIAVAMTLLGCFHYLPSTTIALMCFVPFCFVRTPCSSVLFGLSMMFNANASPKKHIGMVNSIAQSGQALARSITPMLAAPLFAWSVTGGFGGGHGGGGGSAEETTSAAAAGSEGDSPLPTLLDLIKETVVKSSEVHMFPFNHFLVFICCSVIALLTFALGRKIPNAVITVRRK